MNKQNNINYYAPLVPHKASPIQDEKWNELEQLFYNKHYDNYSKTLIEYINPNLLKYKKDDGYYIPHGSVQIILKQSNDKLIISAPFLDISEANKLPLMRKLAELKQHPLNLTDIKLEVDKVYFQFECPLSLCHPDKIYAVLRNICMFADMYDDEFIEKFNAKNLQEPVIEPLEENIHNMAYQNYQQIINDCLQRHEAYMAKRDGSMAWYTLNICLKQIAFHINPQGYLRTLIERAADDLSSRQVSFYDALVNGKKAIEKLKAYKQEKFNECLYVSETFVPYKYKGKKENIRNSWEGAYEDVCDMMNNQEYEDASVLIQSLLYNLLYFNQLPEELYEIVVNALQKSSNKTWVEAAQSLYEGMQCIMEDNMQNDNAFGMDISNLMQEQMKQSMAMMQKMFGN